MHHPSSKFVIHQALIAGVWSECHADELATPTSPRRRLAVMPDYAISATRWQDREGQTYHRVRLFDLRQNSYKLIGEDPFVYGYGDQWQVTALKLVQRTLPDLFPPSERSSGHAGAYLRDECNIACSVSDVARKKDM